MLISAIVEELSIVRHYLSDSEGIREVYANFQIVEILKELLKYDTHFVTIFSNIHSALSERKVADSTLELLQDLLPPLIPRSGYDYLLKDMEMGPHLSLALYYQDEIEYTKGITVAKKGLGIHNNNLKLLRVLQDLYKVNGEFKEVEKVELSIKRIDSKLTSISSVRDFYQSLLLKKSKIINSPAFRCYFKGVGLIRGLKSLLNDIRNYLRVMDHIITKTNLVEGVNNSLDIVLWFSILASLSYIHFFKRKKALEDVFNIDSYIKTPQLETLKAHIDELFF